jgi:hypothetical protein
MGLVEMGGKLERWVAKLRDGLRDGWQTGEMGGEVERWAQLRWVANWRDGWLCR